MVHMTLAVGDFMLMLISSALWVAAGIAVVAAVVLGCCGGVIALVRRMRRGR